MILISQQIDDSGTGNQPSCKDHMLPLETKLLLDQVTSIPLSQSKEMLRSSWQKSAEKTVAAGIAGSGLARSALVKLHYDHFEVLCNQVWSEIKRVLQEMLFEGYPGCEDDIIAYWQRSLEPGYDESRSVICALLTPANEVAQQGFKDYCARVEKRISAEIRVFCAKLNAAKKEKA